jgi:hypothetical protein
MTNENKKSNKPADKVKAGRVEVAWWNHTNAKGESFSSYAISKRFVQKDDDNPNRFITEIKSLSGLFKSDLINLRETIDEALKTVENEPEDDLVSKYEKEVEL